MKIHVKYMVSNCCKMMLALKLNELGLHHGAVELGEVEVQDIDSKQYRELKNALSKIGLELIDDKKSVLIEKVKNLIIELVYDNNEMLKSSVSNYLTSKLHHNYPVLSTLFSEVTGTTIEKYLINIRIERAKEMLLYGEENLTEISYSLNYSSVAHLSNQFKKVTGLTPTYFKNLKQHKRRVALESL